MRVEMAGVFTPWPDCARSVSSRPVVSPEVFLLVEDNPHDAFLFDRALKEARPQAQLVVLCTMKAAFAYLGEFNAFRSRQLQSLPLRVALDMRLPDGHGSELIRWMRSQPGLKGLAIIVVTGSCDPRDAEAAANLGVDAYLIKSAEIRELAARLASLPMVSP